MNYTKIIVIILLCISVISCTKTKEEKLYGKLRDDVLNHYELDNNPLKIKAARFLLDNLKDRYTIEGQRYKKYTDAIKKYYQNGDTLHNKLISVRNEPLDQDTVMDINRLTSELLIDNIDRAFAAWEKVGWKDQISFDNFCEYILPYRIGNEPIENWRKNVVQDSLIKSIIDTIIAFTDLRKATTYLSIKQSRIKKNFKFKFGANSANTPDLQYSTLKKLSAGTCTDLTRFGVFESRAVALPIANDFTPNWANHSSGHDWAALITKDHSIPFILLVIDSLGIYKSDDLIPSKVYRHTFSENEDSHIKQRGYCSFLPHFFNN